MLIAAKVCVAKIVLILCCIDYAADAYQYYNKNEMGGTFVAIGLSLLCGLLAAFL